MKPFLKWPGGKRWLISYANDYLNQNYNNYIEPFLGGGAIFFYLKPKTSLISDINEDLVNVYIVLRDNYKELINQLIKHQNSHNTEYYYKIRSTAFDDKISRAAQFLYLNRACYNGMYRVNKNGYFNVPIGTKTNFLYDIESFETYSLLLRESQIRSCDFEISIAQAGENDLIFADPPYAALKNDDKAFTGYNDKLFTWNDQKRLFRSLINARERGAKIVATNLCCQDIIEMYNNAQFNVIRVRRSSTISGKKENRKSIEELLITSI